MSLARLLTGRLSCWQKAAVRACRNSIEFNSIPSIDRLVPGGYENLLLHIKIGVPHPVRQAAWTMCSHMVTTTYNYAGVSEQTGDGMLVLFRTKLTWRSARRCSRTAAQPGRCTFVAILASTATSIMVQDAAY